MEYLAEFLGVFVLIVINNGVVANVVLKDTKGQGNSPWILITIGAGLAVTFGIYTAMIYSNAHINPAVTIAFLLIGKMDFLTAVLYIVSQMIGGMMGALVVYLLYKKHYDRTMDEEKILATFSTSPAIDHRFWNIITEIIATFFLVGMVVVVTSDVVGMNSVMIPIVIGLLVMVLGISLGGSTGFAMNPARDLGPRITHSLLHLGNSDWKYAIVPVIGPIIGGFLGALIFSLYLGNF